MSNRSRAKGLKGERDITAQLVASGCAVRGLEGSGDMLVITPRQRRTLAVEVKRYAVRARWSEWLVQVQADAPEGIPWVLVARGDRRQALALLPLADLLELIA
jgi:hypothetical protein